ncbi:hypothetical protein BDW22DRAFT_1326630 [Trametopsis cervina]|nr:hypothetical protein BDW22DRAFT_1326630 [Trametopsis cervina]
MSVSSPDKDKRNTTNRWEHQVQDRLASWKSARRGHQSFRLEQLTWEANVVEYVNYISGSKAAVSIGQPKKGTYQLPASVPLWGPIFHPPTFSNTLVRGTARDKKTGALYDIKPDLAYLRPITVLHPFYFPRLRRCPRNMLHQVTNDGWQSNGSREVHGMYHEQSAIGFQLRCEVPHFFHKCAVTRDLFDLIIELRPSLTALGIATHVEQNNDLQKRLTYRKSLAITLSFDHTYRITRKATINTQDGSRDQVWKGGMFSAVNEKNEIVLYVRSVEITHINVRYEAVIIGGVHNAYRGAVSRDIVEAILERPAENGKPAIWRNKEEQAARLDATYKKWLAHGNVWSQAAAKAHAVQMSHVEKGCLSRPRNDVRSDGSRIEGSHKGWNSLQRANPSGYEGILNLAGDHVLRRNVRVRFKSKEFAPTPFLASTFGSHHISLVDHNAHLWNSLLQQHSPTSAGRGVLRLEGFDKLQTLEVIEDVPSGESFGAVISKHAQTFGGLLKIEEEEEDDFNDAIDDEDTQRREILEAMSIDPALASIYEQKVYIPIDPLLLDNSSSSHVIPRPREDI